MRKERRRYFRAYTGAAFFCLIFAAVYEYFSHDVVSYYMVLAFLIPLAGGLIITASFPLFRGRTGSIFRQLMNGALTWLTLGSIFEGVLEIYGTTNRLIIIFPVIGALQLIPAVLCLIISLLKHQR